MIKRTNDFISNVILNSSMFRVIYIIDMFCASIVFMEEISLVFRCIILSWGLVILVNKFIVNRSILKIRYSKMILAFILSNILTICIHIGPGFLANALSVYHITVCLIIFYGMYIEADSQKLKKEIIIICEFMVIITTILAVVGLTLFIFKTQFILGRYYIGMDQNRFVGIYTNSNLVAFSGVVAIVFAHCLLKISKRDKSITVLRRPFLLVSIALNFLSLVLSDSNASFILLVLYCIICCSYWVLCIESKSSSYSKIKKALALVFLLLFIAVISFSIRGIFQNAVSMLINDMIGDTDQGVVIGRENYDITYGSGRSILLVQGWEMFLHHPILGIGRGNLLLYAKRYLEGGLRYSDLHNGYLTILVCSGLVGFCIFFYFGVLLAKDMTQYLILNRKNKQANIFPNLFAFIVGYCVYSLFEKTIFTEITFMVMAFWLIVGYATAYMINDFKIIDDVPDSIL